MTVKTWSRPHKRQDFEMTVAAPVADVWRALATTEGLREHFLSEGEVELRPFGRYAIWPGATNRVLSYFPGEMLSTSGSAPPQFPEVRKGGTWGAYFLEPAGPGSTRLRLSVLGWKEGEEWNRAFEYFVVNNPAFLKSLRAKLEEKADGTARSLDG